MVNLSFNQMCVLSAVANEDRYGLQIIETVKEESGIKLILGSLYNILYKLEKEGLVTSYFGEATAERGGNRRKYYKISAKGETTLNEAQLGLINLWGGASFLQKLFPNLKLGFVKQLRFGAILLFMLLISNMPIYAASISETLSYLIFSPVFVFFFFLLIFFLASVKLDGLANYKEKIIMKINGLKKFESKELSLVFLLTSGVLLVISLLSLLLLVLLYDEKTILEGVGIVLLEGAGIMLLVGSVLGAVGIEMLKKYLFPERNKILSSIISKISKTILPKQKFKEEQKQTTTKIIRYFSYTLPSAKREEIVGDLNETIAVMRKDKVKPFVICIVLSWQMTRILFAMISVKLSDFVSDKEKEQSK